MTADELQFAVKLLKPGDPRYRPAVERLANLLNNYTDAAMPSAQRLFLMDELSALPEAPPLPTREAERLALRLLDIDTADVPGKGLERTRIPDVWKIASPSRRALPLSIEPLPCKARCERCSRSGILRAA